jgi:hypothetical protein
MNAGGRGLRSSPAFFLILAKPPTRKKGPPAPDNRFIGVRKEAEAVAKTADLGAIAARLG